VSEYIGYKALGCQVTRFRDAPALTQHRHSVQRGGACVHNDLLIYSLTYLLTYLLTYWLPPACPLESTTSGRRHPPRLWKRHGPPRRRPRNTGREVRPSSRRRVTQQIPRRRRKKRAQTGRSRRPAAASPTAPRSHARRHLVVSIEPSTCGWRRRWRPQQPAPLPAHWERLGFGIGSG